MMGLEKSYARATISSNLRSDEHHHQVDVLAAVALAGLITNAPASKLFRLKYANDVSSYNSLLAEWETMVGIKAVTRKWPQHANHCRIAKLALDYWLNDLCRECNGKGVKPLPDLPNVLSDDPCPACNGTGKARVVCEKRDLKYVEDMVETLEAMVRYAAGQAMRKLADDMDF